MNNNENHPSQANHALLKQLYQDLTRISEFPISRDIILHPADRDLSTPPRQPLRGVEAVQAHEDALVTATGGTLVMDVSCISATEHFGTVLGILRASSSSPSSSSSRGLITGGGGGGDGGGSAGDGNRKDTTTQKEKDLAVPFCGVWRFQGGKLVEHWENAADPAELGRWLAASASGTSS